MPKYICLMRITAQGLSGPKSLQEKMQECLAIAESMGSKVEGVWMTMGQYDFVSLVEAKDDLTKAAESLAVAGTGYVTVETLRAFDAGEMAQIQAKVS